MSEPETVVQFLSAMCKFKQHWFTYIKQARTFWECKNNLEANECVVQFVTLQLRIKMLWETACPLFDDGQLSFEYCEFVVVMAHPPDSLAPPLIKSWLRAWFTSTLVRITTASTMVKWSVPFGASHEQASPHTVVIYIASTEPLRLCTVSANLDHNPLWQLGTLEACVRVYPGKFSSDETS